MTNIDPLADERKKLDEVSSFEREYKSALMNGSTFPERCITKLEQWKLSFRTAVIQLKHHSSLLELSEMDCPDATLTAELYARLDSAKNESILRGIEATSAMSSRMGLA